MNLPLLHPVSWNALISGNISRGSGSQALECFRKMQLQGVVPNSITYICSLKACGMVRDTFTGSEIYAELIRRNFMKVEPDLGCSVVDMYVKCGLPEKADEVFNTLLIRNAATWNALIGGYVKHMLTEKAIVCLDRMRIEGIISDAITFSSMFQVYSNIKASDKGCIRHAEIYESGILHTDVVLGSTLMDMYMNCGLVSKAHRVFDELFVRDMISWTTIIGGYLEKGHAQKALTCFDHMQLEGIPPDVVVFSYSLRACGYTRDGEKGKEIHADLEKRGLLEKNDSLYPVLVAMYAKCGFLTEAYSIFMKSTIRDVALWNILIGGYANHELGEKALGYFHKMQCNDVSPDVITFTYALKAIGCIRDTKIGAEIHAEIERQGLIRRHIIVGNALVDMYAKCGEISRIQEVFHRIPCPDRVTWNVLISGYVKRDYSHEALTFFDEMVLRGIYPNSISFSNCLRACINILDVEKGRELHCNIVREGLLGTNFILGAMLVELYAKCGFLQTSEEVFTGLPSHNVVTWNALISGYAKHGHFLEIFDCFEQMQHDAIHPDPATFSFILKACSMSGDLDIGIELHAEIERTRVLECELTVCSALVEMYASCSFVVKAEEVFDSIAVPDLACWNALISGFVNLEPCKVFYCFQQMQSEGLSPDIATFISVLKACSGIQSKEKGKLIHAVIQKGILVERDLAADNALIDFYVKCECFSKAQEIFKEVVDRSVVTWNVMITGYVKNGCVEEALEYFRQMEEDGYAPDAITFSCVLKACGCIRDNELGKELHDEIERKGMLGEHDSIVGNGLVDMYVSCGSFLEAQKVFEKLSNRDVVSWNALIIGYVQYQTAEEALRCFSEMQIDGVPSDNVTFIYILKACGALGASEKGREVHMMLQENRQLSDDVNVVNALVDMYAKCGLLSEAQESFNRITTGDLVSWNIIIAGHGLLGDIDAVSDTFNILKGEDWEPDSVTFLNILYACNHAGLIAEAHAYFNTMCNDHNIKPNVEHYTSMIEMMGRAGQLDVAEFAMRCLPFHPDIIMCCTFLGACLKWSNLKLGEKAFEHVMELDDKETASYVYMCNVYADGQFWA